MIDADDLHKHFMIGCFKKNYFLEYIENNIVKLIKNVFNEDYIFYGLLEDMLEDETLACQEALDGLWTALTTVTVNDVIYKDFFNENATAGMLHITTTPDKFIVEIDLVDFPKVDFINNIKKEYFAKNTKDLENKLRIIKDKLIKLKPKIEKIKPEYEDAYER